MREKFLVLGQFIVQKRRYETSLCEMFQPLREVSDIIIIKSFSNSDAVFKLFMLIKAEQNLIFMKSFSFNDVSNQKDATNSVY